MTPQLNADQLLQDLEALGRIGGSGEEGVNRVAYTPADQEGRAWVEVRMHGLGMNVKRDAVGNSIGTWSGSRADLPPIALGSHTDTVPSGGRYDGALGVISALACIQALRDAGVWTRHPIEVINFAAEEGATLGSRAMAGLLDPAFMDQFAWDGRPFAEHLRSASLDPAVATRVARPKGSLAAFLELHVEQGGMLEEARVSVGVVEGIVGIRRYAVSFRGHANHAGTTPMANRRDALLMAAPFILAVRKVAVARGIVGTVGTLRVQPGVANVIPGQVDLDTEIRGLREADLIGAEEELVRLALASGAEFRYVSSKPPVASDPRLLTELVAACKELGLSYQRMPSGAGHDAMCMAAICPQAMIFVPSRGGISHSPDEFTEPESCVAGAQLLLAALLKLDTRLDA